MKNLEAEVTRMGHLSIVIDCNQREYQKLERCVCKYSQFISIGIGNVRGNPPFYEDVEINIAPNDKTNRKKYLECLRDLTRILLPN